MDINQFHFVPIHGINVPCANGESVTIFHVQDIKRRPQFVDIGLAVLFEPSGNCAVILGEMDAGPEIADSKIWRILSYRPICQNDIDTWREALRTARDNKNDTYICESIFKMQGKS